MGSAKNQYLPEYAADLTTGFLHRSDCALHLSQLAAQSDSAEPTALIWIALDRLKQINTSFGHQSGDAVLTHIAGLLRAQSPADTQWYRMSGDEFLGLIPDSDLEQAQQLARHLLCAIESPLPMEDLLLHPSASLGIAQYEAHESPASCLARADHAMNTAKRAGGGQVVTSGSEPLPGKMGIHLAHQELKLENQLHQALSQGGLHLHYQPTVNQQGHVVSVEALMRCPHHGISPNQFIPIAEKTGLIARLGEWSLLEGARFAQQLHQLGHHAIVSINVSRAQLTMPHFPQILHAALLCANVNPKHIELELTESLFMENTRVIQSNLAAALDAGVKIAIDDFGTGYSSLSTLKDIHATKLKIDRAFVVALPDDPRAFSIIRAIARLGQELGMEIVAEGVENRAQVDALYEAGVQLIQGYFYARPMSDTALLSWLNNREQS